MKTVFNPDAPWHCNPHYSGGYCTCDCKECYDGNVMDGCIDPECIHAEPKHKDE